MNKTKWTEKKNIFVMQCQDSWIALEQKLQLNFFFFFFP